LPTPKGRGKATWREATWRRVRGRGRGED